MICFPNAKINLGLGVVSKRDDGFHNISSLLYPIPYYDILEFLPSNSYKLNSFGLGSEILEKDNLVTRAWILMHQNYGIPTLHIKLLKQIPIGSGLGGGSSDAAFFIKSVNQYFELNLSNDELHKIASQIGSDCPFFIQNKPLMVSEKGDLIKTVDFSLNDKFVVLVMPGINISSKEMYTKVIPSIPEIPIFDILKQPIETWPENLINDFEKSLFDFYPEMSETKSVLYQKGALYASLTGSGSAFYGIFNENPGLSSTDFGHAVHSMKLDNHTY